VGSPAFVSSLLLLGLALVGVFINIFFVSNYAFWVAIAAYVILYWGSGVGANWPGIISLFLLGLAVVGVFINIPIVSNYAFWFAVAAYVIRDWTFNTATAPVLVWAGVISLLAMLFALAGVFVNIPIVSNYAFWFVILAYVFRILAVIPGRIPNRIGVVVP
jgi:hypothetical protein